MTQLDKQNLTKHFKDKKRIVLCSAKSNHFVEDVHKDILKNLQDEDPQTENVVLNGAEIDPAVLHAELMTVPMFNTTRFIWLRHSENVFKKLIQNKTIYSYFVRDIPLISESNFFLAHLDEPKLPKELEFMNGLSMWIKEPQLTESEVASYLLERVKQMGFETDFATMQAVCEKCNYNFKLSLSTLDQLFAFCLDLRKIDLEAVKEVCYDMEGDFVFQISNLILERKINKALFLLEKHHLKEPMMMFGFWAKIFQEANRYLLFSHAGIASSSIQSTMNLNYRSIQNIQKLTYHYSKAELEKIANKLVFLDQRIKENSNIEFQKNILSVFIANLN